MAPLHQEDGLRNGRSSGAAVRTSTLSASSRSQQPPDAVLPGALPRRYDSRDAGAVEDFTAGHRREAAENCAGVAGRRVLDEVRATHGQTDGAVVMLAVGM